VNTAEKSGITKLEIVHVKSAGSVTAIADIRFCCSLKIFVHLPSVVNDIQLITARGTVSPEELCFEGR